MSQIPTIIHKLTQRRSNIRPDNLGSLYFVTDILLDIKVTEIDSKSHIRTNPFKVLEYHDNTKKIITSTSPLISGKSYTLGCINRQNSWAQCHRLVEKPGAQVFTQVKMDLLPHVWVPQGPHVGINRQRNL